VCPSTPTQHTRRTHAPTHTRRTHAPYTHTPQSPRRKVVTEAAKQLDDLSSARAALLTKLEGLGAGAPGSGGDEDDFEVQWPEAVQDLLAQVRAAEGKQEGGREGGRGRETTDLSCKNRLQPTPTDPSNPTQPPQPMPGPGLGRDPRRPRHQRRRPGRRPLRSEGRRRRGARPAKRVGCRAGRHLPKGEEAAEKVGGRQKGGRGSGGSSGGGGRGRRGAGRAAAAAAEPRRQPAAAKVAVGVRGAPAAGGGRRPRSRRYSRRGAGQAAAEAAAAAAAAGLGRSGSGRGRGRQGGAGGGAQRRARQDGGRVGRAR
jgi:hypothetical protein